MPAKKQTTTVAKKTTKKDSPKTNVVLVDDEADYTENSQIAEQESNHELNIELMEKVDILTKKLENAAKVQQEFVDSFSSLKEFSSSSIKEIDVKIKKKDEECYNKLDQMSKKYALKLYNLRSEYEKKQYDLDKSFQQKRDEMEREFSSYEYEKAVEVIKEKDEISVKKDEFSKLKNELEALTKNQTKREGEIAAEVAGKWKRDMDQALKTKDLEFRATNADMKASIDQMRLQSETLHETIDTLKDEIKEQRKLTKSVADAAQGAITQNYGK